MNTYLQQGYEWIPTSSTFKQYLPTKLDIYNHPMVIKGERESKAGETISVGRRNTYNTIRRERERRKAGETISVWRHNTYNTIRRERERGAKLVRL